jgi:hypothetical protein
MCLLHLQGGTVSRSCTRRSGRISIATGRYIGNVWVVTSFSCSIRPTSRQCIAPRASIHSVRLCRYPLSHIGAMVNRSALDFREYETKKTEVTRDFDRARLNVEYLFDTAATRIQKLSSPASYHAILLIVKGLLIGLRLQTLRRRVKHKKALGLRCARFCARA